MKRARRQSPASLRAAMRAQAPIEPKAPAPEGDPGRRIRVWHAEAETQAKVTEGLVPLDRQAPYDSAEALAGEWDDEIVFERLGEAARVLARLPDRERGWLRQRSGRWPEVVQASLLEQFYEVQDRAYKPANRRAAPAADAISRMEATFEWCRWLEGPELRIVWALAFGIKQAQLCRQIGCHRHTVLRAKERALRKIVETLNAKNEPVVLAADTRERLESERLRAMHKEG